LQASTFIYVISLQDLFKFIYKKDSKKNVTSAHALMLQIILYIMLYQTMIYRITVPVSTQLPSIYCSIMLSAFKRLCVRQDVHWAISVFGFTGCLGSLELNGFRPNLLEYIPLYPGLHAGCSGENNLYLQRLWCLQHQSHKRGRLQ